MTGDQLGQPIPADPVTLRAAGPEFLTRAFWAAGTLAPDDAVTHITRFGEVAGGSTGRKATLSVRYRNVDTKAPTELFVKFSRDFDNPVRDLGRTQMEPEVRFAELSRAPGFPIVVPTVLFGDYHRATATGLLITERITFGDNGIEPHYAKCLDYQMPQPVAHYRAVLTALGRLAGAHRSGHLPAALGAQFPLNVAAATVGDRAPSSARRLDRRLAELAEFVDNHPMLLCENVAPHEFLPALSTQAPRFAAHHDTVLRELGADADYIALCHWNANVDNAWFWRDRDGVLQCGLMDWGCVSQMNVGMAIWGALSGAEADLWDGHLDQLLQLFVAEMRRYGGPPLDTDRVRRHTVLYAATMGVAWLFDVPALLSRRFGADMPQRRDDPRIQDDESLRAPLQMLSNVLNLWARYRPGDLLDLALAEGDGSPNPARLDAG
ncbi:hypothetical protein [Mycobacterium sp. 1423905.2]|uniref:hypothetical protein n=1 Tax=Mycobacterium sp. 1423905.2 TaxID=1856859 RepID=UPI000802064A|nr:hypothetical protein [Mycobacterium sp. 1423905.2]OBJ49279.1 hypothetical protein A9W95_02325 [Mycobacterium sp. 1423905.2]